MLNVTVLHREGGGDQPGAERQMHDHANPYGDEEQLPPRRDAVEGLHDEQHAECYGEIEERGQRARNRQDEPREVHLADQIGVADKGKARFVQGHAEQIPHEQTSEREQKVGWTSRPRAGDNAEREVQDACCDNRLHHDPADAEHGLPVPQLDVAPRELQDQILEFDELVEIDGHPPRRRAKRAERCGLCDAHSNHFVIDR